MVLANRMYPRRQMSRQLPQSISSLFAGLGFAVLVEYTVVSAQKTADGGIVVQLEDARQLCEETTEVATVDGIVGVVSYPSLHEQNRYHSNTAECHFEEQHDDRPLPPRD